MKNLNYQWALLLGAAALTLFGCAQGDPPNYQGRQRPAPTVEDYYPSPTNRVAAKPADHQHHVEGRDHGAIKIPDKAAEIFAETEKHLNELAAAVKAKDARAAHEHDAAVRELMGRIPQRAEIKTEVDEHVREISGAVKSAHAAAHDEDWSKADADVKRAQESLKHFRSHFKEIPR